ncbi:MAG TPA: Flp family type IVb pilin [Brevundimonas sp.]|nr:Flp family type IVb pilin [Brevundimonas sp.]
MNIENLVVNYLLGFTLGERGDLKTATVGDRAACLSPECKRPAFGGPDFQSDERSKPMTKLMSYLTDENGASAAEYALILAIVGTGIAAAAFALGGSITGAMNRAVTCINSATGVC